MKLWGGRFETGPSEVFERFSGSLHFDRRLIDADIRGSQAFARALEDIGILTAEERGQIFDALVQIRTEPVPLNADDEDVHTFVIRRLKEVAGAVADKIHTGRSRNEQVSLDTRLWLRDECDRVDALLKAWLSVLLDLADKYPHAIIPGYTHMRRAQPVLWPHYLLAYFDMFSRDRERFHQERAEGANREARAARGGARRESQPTGRLDSKGGGTRSQGRRQPGRSNGHAAVARGACAGGSQLA